MSSMVVSLELMKVITDVFNLYKRDWQLRHIDQFLVTLELVYWHARSFNENLPLRKQLNQRGFMQFNNDLVILPHLLEQEIYALSLVQLMTTKFFLSRPEDNDFAAVPAGQLKEYSRPWFQR